MTLAWNIVAKNIHPHQQLQRKLRDKIGKLERHLQHFPPDAVHLQVALDRNPKKNLFTAALTLRVPSNVLRSAKSASDPVPALDQAVKALLRELGAFKADLRRESAWKRRARRQELHEAKPLRFTAHPLLPGHGPQTPEDLIRQVVTEQYGSLLNYVQRRIGHGAMDGIIPPHAIDAEAVADEVVQQAISRAHTKPPEYSYRFWLFYLAGRELERRFHEFRDRAITDVPIEAVLDPARRGPRDEDYLAQARLLHEDDLFDASDDTAGASLPDAHLAPDLAVAQGDLVQYLQQVSRAWEPRERALFELHYLEGFEPDELAMLENLKAPQVRELLEHVQGRLRDALTEAMKAKVSNRKAPLARMRNV
jgi:ribosomal subunit interface protein